MVWDRRCKSESVAEAVVEAPLKVDWILADGRSRCGQRGVHALKHLLVLDHGWLSTDLLGGVLHVFRERLEVAV